jgi:two-component system CheB/CheR fusion protein
MNPQQPPDTTLAEPILPPDPGQDLDLQPSGLQFAVVDFGSSAGGTQAATRFFERMPIDSGMAFVVVMHLSPSY